MFRSFTFSIFAVALTLGSLVQPLSAEDSPLEVSNLTIGLDGSFRLGAWTAVEFDLAGSQAESVTPILRAVDPDGSGTLQPLTKSPAGSGLFHVRGLFRSGKLNASLQVQLREGDQILQTIPLRVGPNAQFRALKQSTSVWLAVGNQPVFTRGIERWNTFLPGSAHLVAIPDFQRPLWSSAILDGIDVIAITGDVALDDQTSDALRNWVQRGGRLIVSVGNTVSQLNASPLAGWLPLIPQGQIDVAKLTGIQELVPRSSQLRTLVTLPAAQLDRSQGIVIASGLSGPLIMRAACGAGQVTMVAVRMDEAPLSTWEVDSQAGLAGVLAAIPLPWETSVSEQSRRGDAEFDPSTVTDLQSQLNHTLEHFQGISRVAPWTVIGWIAFFALVIGPIDYLLVRHVLHRPEWTWGTMVLWVLLGSGLAISYGNTLNDHSPVARQIDCVDVDLTTNSLRGQSWYSFYSDLSQRLKVDVALNKEFSQTPPTSLRVGWRNRPGEGFRGMSGSGGLDESKPQYQFFQDEQGIDNLPVRKWSTGALTCDWESAAPAEQLVKVDLMEAGFNRMTGTIEHHLPGELTDWFLAYGNFAYFERPAAGQPAQPLPPGKVWNVGQAGSNLLRGRLISIMQERITGRQSTAADDQLQRIAYDANSTDPLICELVTSFYRVLGGENYTGLRNDSLKRLDLSETISLKRAVLFGRLKLTPTQYQLNGQAIPQQEESVMIRLILPVQQSSRDPDAPPPADILAPRK
ncbi:hypothetical protein SH661x_001501 [Planctomicrobium sp. SH661]|uniref:hypothetical protein n=1 Tax=Planctomicrobium sp. SH661 TaxID=3448124 RepID=UPI003F5B533D